MKDTNEYIRDEAGAFEQMQTIVCEMSGFADILDARQGNMKAAEFWLSEHLICLIRKLNAINRAERPLTGRELREATGRFYCEEVEPSAPKQMQDDQTVEIQAKEGWPTAGFTVDCTFPDTTHRKRGQLRDDHDTLSAKDFAGEIQQTVFKIEALSEALLKFQDEMSNPIMWTVEMLLEQVAELHAAVQEVV